MKRKARKKCEKNARKKDEKTQCRKANENAHAKQMKRMKEG